MTKEDHNIYNKAVRRLSRSGIKDPTAQIIALEKEIDYYRDKIKRYESKGYRPTLRIIDETHTDPCPTCYHRYWGDPECHGCNKQNGFRYYKPMEE